MATISTGLPPVKRVLGIIPCSCRKSPALCTTYCDVSKNSHFFLTFQPLGTSSIIFSEVAVPTAWYLIFSAPIRSFESLASKQQESELVDSLITSSGLFVVLHNWFECISTATYILALYPAWKFVMTTFKMFQTLLQISDNRTANRWWRIMLTISCNFRRFSNFKHNYPQALRNGIL